MDILIINLVFIGRYVRMAVKNAHLDKNVKFVSKIISFKTTFVFKMGCRDKLVFKMMVRKNLLIIPVINIVSLVTLVKLVLIDVYCVLRIEF